ncbi:restriction endonuclease [Mycobacterium sp. 852002-51163_SCH5372311]|uniref:restriction endonuclease n=1 Tax=Mycobacterium sp. 852002-51163_SCH5372311 TaxID=1834097 RepID=UPI0007FED5D4|nr:restriction endonuclease [Mycobacterium sp. 852002-51163_SCH5372311]OBF85002.1 restriction endonuclease [Mycobacterium sp. 852002-51163_SCH5372311]
MGDSGRAVPFEELPTSDLHLEAVYLGGSQKNVSDDPLNRLVRGVGNQGGFRHVGSPWQKTVRVSVLYTSGEEVDWPDCLDPQTGEFTYYGDNRTPGHELHDTRRGGNVLLRDAFEAAHGASEYDRLRVPPFLLFEKAFPGRAVRFRGLLAPGSATLAPDEELTAIWRNKSGLRFQNYRAKFTVLDVATVSRSWLDAVRGGAPTTTDGCPTPWRNWVEGRVYTPLIAPPTMVVRSREQQLPDDKVGASILSAIRHHFHGRPTDFEECAVEIWRMIAPGTGNCYITPPRRDGGRDAVGEYPLGPLADRIILDFALEAKCYAATNSVGVKDVSRLIARLRPRNFGVFVTTSYFGSQVYDEVRSDQHPIALICARDVIEALREKGYGDVAAVQAWLTNRFPNLATAP